MRKRCLYALLFLLISSPSECSRNRAKFFGSKANVNRRYFKNRKITINWGLLWAVDNAHAMTTNASSSSPMWMENLSEWILDEGRVVSVKSLSRSLRVHVNTAKEQLFHFAQEKGGEADLEVILLLAGRDREGRRQVRLARQEKAQDGSFSSLTSKHVYAVAKRNVLAAGEHILTAAVLDAAREGDSVTGMALSAVANR